MRFPTFIVAKGTLACQDVGMFKRQTILACGAYMILVTLVAAIVFGVAYKRNLDQIVDTGTIRIEQARDRLIGQLSGFRQLTNLLTKDPRIVPLLNVAPNPATNDFLLNTALSSGADDIYVLNHEGTAIAAASFKSTDSIIGRNFASQPHVVSALDGSLGFFHTLDNGSRNFLFARAILDANGIPSGVVVVQIDISALEFEWRIDEDVIAFFDKNDVAFVTNRPSLEMRRIWRGGQVLVDPNSYNASDTRPMFSHNPIAHFDHTIWTFDSAEDFPASALVVSLPIPQLQLFARVFLDVQPAQATALVLAVLVSAVLTMIGLFLLVLRQRRQNLSDRLAIEEEANAKLEARVEDRTQQLRAAQHQLIEAGKLTALGQMSASISHELNQPLAAMQNFAENGAKFLELNRTVDAQENFGLIADQINRMNRIIKSLRAFARKEKETIEPVNIESIINDSLALSAARCEAEEVTIHVGEMPKDTMVLGGNIRLQQVIINLFTNSIDALMGSSVKEIFVTVTSDKTTLTVWVRDSGPGLDNPDRVFEPFFSTKDIGASKGLGLGLSISHGIVGSFGGRLTCQNLSEGGAEFAVNLRRAYAREAG